MQAIETPMILFLYGQDTFRSRQHLKKLIEKFKKDRDPQGLNMRVFDAEKAPWTEVMEEIGALPFLAEKRMVVVENIVQSKQKEFQASVLKKLEEQSFPESTVIIFWEEIDTAKTKDAKALFDRLRIEKYAQAFDLLEGSKLTAWIAEEIAERGGTIHRDAAQYLADHVGNDMWRLTALIDQLCAFTKEEIKVDAVAQFVSKTEDDNIFHLVEALVKRKKETIFTLIEEQYAIGNDAGYVFAMIVRQFRLLLSLRDIIDRTGEKNEGTLAKLVGQHPFAVKQALPIAQQYSFAELRDIHESLLDMDINMKTGGLDMKTSLDLFVGKLCLGK